MTDLDALKQNILSVIKDDNYNINDLINLLGPISLCTSDPLFTSNIDSIVSIVTKDRDGNNKFTIDDLKLLTKDVIGVTSLITAILLVVNTIPNLKLQYKADDSEELIFKLLAYVFLVVVPKKTGHVWSYEEKVSVLDLTLLIYQLVKSSQLAQGLIQNVAAAFKTNRLCSCLSTEDEKEVILEKNLSKAKIDLKHAMNNLRDKSVMMHDIKKIKRSLSRKSKK